MKSKRFIMAAMAVATAAGTLAGCSGEKEVKQQGAQSDKPVRITIATPQVGEAPKNGSDVELAMEKYTKTELDFQWIPTAAFEDKKNIMIASNEMPKAFKITYNATSLNAIKNGLFWEIGPLLGQYKNLAGLDPAYYDNIKVDGKLYGLPLYRNIGRAGVVYRKDWFDELGLKQPVTLDDWYNILKVVAEKDPDKNNQNDTYGLFLEKGYNDAVSSGSFLTRLSVSQGGPNKWGLEGGKVVPEFMTKPYQDSLKFLRKAYQDKLINQDFSIVQAADADNKWNAGKVGIRANTVSTAAATSQDNLRKSVPNAIVDVEPYMGSMGNRVPAEPGNNGFYVFPKSSVKSEEELKQVLTFFDKMLDSEMSTLLTRGIEGRHFTKTADGKAEFKDLTVFNQEVKPYRDSLTTIDYETAGIGMPLKMNELQEKGFKVADGNMKQAVPNIALTLYSPTYIERGNELDTMIRDAQTKYIMGKIDDAGWTTELENWKKAGGSKVIEEFTAEHAKFAK